MSTLIVRHKERLPLPMPYIIAINGRNIGIMRGREIRVEGIPAGRYEITVKCGLLTKKREYMVSGTKEVDIVDNETVTVSFRNHETIWNILFDIDLVLWIAEFFITLPEPWNMVYKIASDGFFVLWMIRVFVIRKRYFRLTIS